MFILRGKTLQIKQLVIDPGTANDRGVQIGEEFRREVRASRDRYVEFFELNGFDNHVIESCANRALTGLESHAPDQYDEMRGTAQSSGVDLRQLAALAARNEIFSRSNLMSPAECSTVLHDDRRANSATTVQTWDMYPELIETCLVVNYEQNGVGVLAFREPGMPNKFGITSNRVAFHMNLLSHKSDGLAEGIPAHAVQQYLMESGKGLDDVIQIARSIPRMGSYVATILDASATTVRAAMVEVSPVGVAKLPNTGPYQYHTNHFIDDSLSNEDRIDGASREDSEARLEAVKAINEANPLPQKLQQRADMLAKQLRAVALADGKTTASTSVKPEIQTLMTFSFDMSEQSMDIILENAENNTVDKTLRFPLHG
ncbi:C45 family peptidase [Nesterenkonia sp. LB17]|uniref:C45 family autoproteolytic acyltransferase/hydolase n=1 Tax=Nesterenkonia sp. LB17 TaxID=2901230 RepID=UPI001F4C82CA|nr:C45 family peptidase [Nesterenkonia sp. LB17]MCH8565266.1 C45 family peptidase [Nesterenkonia sp. LB17]